MDVATLGIAVTQKGVTATATALGKLAEQSVKVTTSVAALQGVLTTLSSTNLTNSSISIRQLAEALVTLSRAMQTIDATSKSFGRVTTSITSLSTAAEKLKMSSAQFASIDANLKGLQSTLANMQGVSTPISNLRAEIGNLQNSIRNLRTSANAGVNLNVRTGNRVGSPAGASGGVDGNRIRSEAERAENSLYRLGRTAATVRNTIFNLFAFGGATALVGATIKLADEMTLLDARIKLVSKDTADFVRIQQGLLQIANSSGQSIQDATANYARMARSTEGMGISSDRLLKVSDGLSKAMVVGGESAGSFNQAMIQLNQGLASGVLRGQELNSVSEQSSQVFKALQIGLGKSAGELRKFAKDGELTSEVVIQALEEGLPSVTEKFDKLPPTVERASNELKNNFAVALNEVNKSGSHTTNLAQGIKGLADSFKSVTPYAIQLANYMPQIVSAALIVGFAKLLTVIASNTVAIVNKTKSSMADIAATRAAAAAEVVRTKAVEENALAQLAQARATGAGIAATDANAAAQMKATAATSARIAAERNLQAAASYTTIVVGRLNKAMAFVGGLPGLIIVGVTAVIMYWDDIAKAIGGASVALKEYMELSKKQLGKGSSVDEAKRLSDLSEAVIDKQQKLNEKKKRFERMGAQAPVAKRFGSQTKNDLKSQIDKEQAELDAARAQMKASSDTLLAMKRKEKAEREDEWRSGFEAPKARVKPPIDGKAQKEAEREAKRQAKLAETLGVKESKVEASIETYKRNIEILKQGGTVQEQLNKHETNAIQLADQLNDVHDKQKIASLQRRIAMEKEAGALLRQNESLEEYVKLQKEATESLDKYLVARGDEAASNLDLSDKYDKMLSDLKIERDLREEISKISSSKMTPEDQKTAKQEATQRADIKKQTSGNISDIASAETFEDIQSITERRIAAQKVAFEIEKSEVAKMYEGKIEEQQRYQDIVEQMTYLHEDRLSAIRKQGNDANLALSTEMINNASNVANSMLSITESLAGKNSGAYKAIFAVQKAFAIATSIINIQKAVSDAFATEATVPQKIAAAAMIASQAASIVSTIAGTNMQGGGKFAKGAAFQGGNVVSTPTYFPMSGGKTGLMGEAGAEAVMPLSRAPDGSLGVRMDGGGGKSVVVNTPISISIESTGGDDKSTAQQTANAVRAAVLTIIQKEKMPGGSLYSR